MLEPRNIQRVLIVEDSLSYSLELERICNSINLDVIGVTDCSADTLEMIYAESPDLIFMDIAIDGKLSGLDVGTKISHLSIPILYITSLKDRETISIASKSNMVAFLIKPVSAARIISLVQDLREGKLMGQQESQVIVEVDGPNKNFLFFRKNETVFKVRISEIDCVKAEDNYCRFLLSNGSSYIQRIKIGDVEKRFSDHRFLRCHRSYIVNMEKSKHVNSTRMAIILESGISVPFSKSKKPLILEHFSENQA